MRHVSLSADRSNPTTRAPRTFRAAIGTLCAALLITIGVQQASGATEIADAPCFECHDELQETFAVGNAHDPVTEGDCESCHEDHGDEERLVLSEEIPALCFGCHDEFEGSVVHDPVGEGDCLACHNPHHAAASALLTLPTPDLCFECHDAFEGESVHSPVEEGECTECHHAHAGPEQALLTAPYDQSLRVVFAEERFELCFNCHEIEAFADPMTGDGTAFRQGARNLHYLHLSGAEEENQYGLAKPKRRLACAGCHLPHAADQDALMRADRQRGKMTVYTLDYRPTEQGGACVVGCHKPLQYRRDGGAPPASTRRPAEISAPKAR